MIDAQAMALQSAREQLLGEKVSYGAAQTTSRTYEVLCERGQLSARYAGEAWPFVLKYAQSNGGGGSNPILGTLSRFLPKSCEICSIPTMFLTRVSRHGAASNCSAYPVLQRRHYKSALEVRACSLLAFDSFFVDPQPEKYILYGVCSRIETHAVVFHALPGEPRLH